MVQVFNKNGDFTTCFTRTFYVLDQLKGSGTCSSPLGGGVWGLECACEGREENAKVVCGEHIT